MNAANHILTGGLIGAAVHEPTVALPVALASHFALDLMPHFGFKDWAERMKYKSLLDRVLKIDFVLAATAVALIISRSPGWQVYACAFLAICPDIAWVYRYIFKENMGTKESPKKNWFNQLHANIQTREFRQGLIIEYPVLAILFYAASRTIR